MEDLTPDELLAHAIGYVALTVMDRLADDPAAKRAFLEGFLKLIEKPDVYPSPSAQIGQQISRP
jgi:hypothetical protein